MAYIKIDETGRVTAASYNFHCGDGEIKVTIPAGIHINNIREYLYINGEFIHSPEQNMNNSDQPEEENKFMSEISSIKAQLISTQLKLDAAMMKIAEQADEIEQLKES